MTIASVAIACAQSWRARIARSETPATIDARRPLTIRAIPAATNTTSHQGDVVRTVSSGLSRYVGDDVLDRVGQRVEVLLDPRHDRVDRGREVDPPVLGERLADRQDRAEQDRQARGGDGRDRDDPAPAGRDRVGAALAPIGRRAGARREPVEDGGQDHDREAGLEGDADVELLERGDDRLAEARRVDERRDHDHRQGHHDRLVDGQPDRAPGHRQLDVDAGPGAGSSPSTRPPRPCRGALRGSRGT